MNSWDFAGLGTSDTIHPSFTFPNNEADNYIVTLIVTNADGCSDTTEQTIIINGIFTLYVPNAFTPDGDQINDVFYPMGDGINPEHFEFIIFNRWGEIVFQTTQLGMGWDGTENSLLSESDVYIWKIKARNIFDDTRYEETGHVTLIR
jgi:gliding motility-associated-like protein